MEQEHVVQWAEYKSTAESIQNNRSGRKDSTAGYAGGMGDDAADGDIHLVHVHYY